jgi:hypothetical protein
MTTMLSIYQARKPVRQMSAHETYLATSTKPDLQLVRLSVDSGKPVLIAIGGVHTIVKPAADGDDRHSYEGLYDDCLTITDLETMQRAGVKRPQDVPPAQVRLSVNFPVQILAGIDLAIKTKNPHESRASFRDLLLKDADFRMALHKRIALIVYTMLCNDAEFEFSFEDQESREGAIEPPLGPAETWRILSPEVTDSEV